MNTRRLTGLAMLTALALIIFALEAQLPAPVPIPGVKLGLANIITVYAAFTMKPADAVMILLCRVLMGSLFAGSAVTLLYSLSGGLLCISITLLLARILTTDQIWIASAAGAVFHNIGQVVVAALILGTAAVFAYLPYLLISGVITGTFTGAAAQAAIRHMARIR